MSRLRLGWMAVCATIAGCVGPGIANQAVYYRVPVVATVTLKRALTVPAGTTRVFFQYGVVVARARLHMYDAECDFEVLRVSDGTARIVPGTFAVTRITTGDDLVVMRRRPLHYAALRLMGDDGMPPLVSRYVDYWLHSPHQPQVRWLTCHGGFGFEGRAKLPTAAEIRRSLGDYVSLGAVAGR